jgi:hypothetical protein
MEAIMVTAQKAQKSDPVAKTRAKTQASKQTKAATLESLGIVAEWSEYKELKQMKFAELLEARTRIKDEIEFRKAKLDKLDEEIQVAMMVAGTEKVNWEDRPVQIVHSRSGSKIVAEKLLMNGVSADVIAESTEPGKEYSYLLVGKAK